MMNAADDPAIRDLGADLLDLSDAAAKSQDAADLAAQALDKIKSSAAGAWMSLERPQGRAMSDWAANERLIRGLERSAETVGDDRQRAIDAALDRLRGNPDEGQRDRPPRAARRI